MKDTKDYLQENQDLYIIGNYFHEITLSALSRIHKFALALILVASIFVWLLMEETIHDYAQSVFFFLGAYFQILIALLIFKNYNFFDPRVIFLARYSST